MHKLLSNPRIAVADWSIDLALWLLPAGPHRAEFARAMRIYRRRSRAGIAKRRRKQTESAQLELTALTASTGPSAPECDQTMKEVNRG